MPICPKCDAVINHLSYIRQTYEDYFMDISKDNKIRTELAEKHVYKKYICPKCGRTLFKKEAKALAFLECGLTSKW